MSEQPTNGHQPVEQELSQDDVQAIEKLKEAHHRVRGELSKLIVGQNDVIEQLLIAIFAQGHCLLEGVPGLAKTLMVSTLAKTLHLDFSRIQFTPDLMPSDITGTEVIQEDKVSGERSFHFLKGPIFSNIILADEINRTPPKTQAALLEAMQESRSPLAVSATHYLLRSLFWRPRIRLNRRGTYTLPEAQQDRFMFKVFVKYPSYDEEYHIAETTTAEFTPEVKPVLSSDEILQLQKMVRRVPVAPHVIHFALRLVRATRIHEGDATEFVKDSVSWGAGPRGVQYLLLGGKARAMLDGRFFRHFR